MDLKALKAGFVLFALLQIVKSQDESKATPAPPAGPQVKCPTHEELGSCICFEPVRHMICNTPTDFLKLKFRYILEKITVKSSKGLSLLSERFYATKVLSTQSLVVLQNDEPLDYVENMDGLVALPTDSIRIMSNGNTTIDTANLLPSLTSISISNVKHLKNFNVYKFKALTNLELIDVTPVEDNDDMFLLDSTLTQIRISNAGLSGVFEFKPKACGEKDKIHIDLRGNEDLSYFDFSQLFKGSPECSYHIDLSGSGLESNFLKNQVANLTSLFLKQEQLYLVMHDLIIDCNCDLYDFYKDRKPYLHSAQCKTKDQKVTLFLDELNEENCKTLV